MTPSHEAVGMAVTAEPRQITMLRTAMAAFPAAWRFDDTGLGKIAAWTSNPAGTVLLRLRATVAPDAIVISAEHPGDGQFMAQAEFPLTGWQAAKDLLEGIALEAFVVGVDQRDGNWTGSMILRSSDLERRGSFSYVRS
jgi:hypothetical protein